MQGAGWLLIAIVLAGCGSPDASEAPIENASVVEAPTPAEVPNEIVPLENGSAGKEHAHDLWGSATRVTLVDEIIDAYGAEDRTVHAAIRIRNGSVLEGTARVEVTLSDPTRSACSPIVLNDVRPCTPPTADPTPPTAMRLLFRHASGSTYEEAGVVRWGEPIVIDLPDPTWVDMPHSGLSRWGFDATSTDIQDDTLEFRAKVDIVRGEGEIPLWPGHPRFYADTHEREVTRASGRTEYTGAHNHLLADGEWPDGSAIGAQKLISFETRTLVVSVNITSVEAPPGTEPGEWDLVFSNASGGWDFTLDPIRADAPAIRWIVPVDEAGMDSPYADASRWRFVVMGMMLVAQGEHSIAVSGLAPYSIDYEILIVASDLPPEAFEDPGLSA